MTRYISAVLTLCAYIRSTSATTQPQTSRPLRLLWSRQACCNVTAGTREASSSPNSQSALTWAWIGWIWERGQPIGIAYAISSQWDTQERVLMRVLVWYREKKCATQYALQLRPWINVKTNLHQASTGWKSDSPDFLGLAVGNRRLPVREIIWVRRAFCP